jgi:hypothetical protein
MAARSTRLQITQDRVLDELSTLAFSDIRNYVVDDKGVVHLAAGPRRRRWRPWPV